MHAKDLMRKNAANAITVSRILGTASLLFIQPLSAPFYVMYTLCGISDALDGPVARRTKSASEFGARLDSVSDLFFYTVLLLRILPDMVRALPGWIWYWVGGVVALRLIAYGIAALKYHRFCSRHTYLNKLTGFTLFVVPYALPQPFFTAWGITACVVATAAVLEELVLHVLCPVYDPRCKSILTALRLQKGNA